MALGRSRVKDVEVPGRFNRAILKSSSAGRLALVVTEEESVNAHRVTAPVRRNSGFVTTARRHHYVPQGYLAAFTDSGEKKGQFHVLDVGTGRRFRTSPKNIAVARDFNRVDIDGLPIDALESALAGLDDLAVKAIRNVISRQIFPDAADANTILNLLGLIAVRSPLNRESFNRAREHTLRVIGQLLVSDRALYERHLRRAHEAGDVPNVEMPYETMKDFIEQEAYEIEFHPEGNSRAEFKVFDGLLPILGRRSWSLLVAPPDGPQFISSDRPVSLIWRDAREAPVGFALRETEVFFPLGRSAAFYGVFERPLPEVTRLNETQVAAMNTRTLMHADRYVVSPRDAFTVRRDGEIREISLKDARVR